VVALKWNEGLGRTQTTNIMHKISLLPNHATNHEVFSFLEEPRQRSPLVTGLTARKPRSNGSFPDWEHHSVQTRPTLSHIQWVTGGGA